jgi:ABC-type multidrug transport system ATPase subunit
VNPLLLLLLQGLDPASRRVLWDVIKAAKPGRAIILTTHNMEEAEVLCDRWACLLPNWRQSQWLD